MPSVTINRAAARSQMYQDPHVDESTRQALELAQQYNQNLLNGVPNTTHSIETIVMSMALEQDVDLSSFSMASQRNSQPSLTSQPISNTPNGQPGQQAPPNINQTQLLSGSRP
ncbi:hypothetical protein BGX27_003705 [Mortierella sp. AM989]|nr:hypothetical protein BGX27_003705 [Mortierella sp. AM989]